MKSTSKLLLAAVMAIFCCSVANAQFSYSNALSLSGSTLIYSNAFNGAAVTVDHTAPTVANSVLGGTNTATWNVVSNNATAGAYLYQDGTIGLLGDSYLLPFVPRSNYVYILTVSANLPAMSSGKWINWGFAQFATNKSTGARFADSAVNGYDFMIGTCVAGSEQYWAGPRATGYGVTAQLMPTAGNHIIQIILDTTGNNGTGTTNWVGTGFVDGKQLGTNYVYATRPVIGAAGMGQTGLSSSTGIQYVYFTLSATPLVIGQQPVSGNVSVGSVFTNKVVVAAVSPYYQWYTSDVPIPGATNASLILNPVTAADAGTNYYVVVTNSLGGSVTSAPVSLTVYTNPVFTALSPITYTNPMTLLGGTNVNGTNYLGSSPTFSVSVLGAPPLRYEWLTNGVAVDGATNASFTFTNCQFDGPTNFTCVVSNSYGEVSNTWLAVYVPAPVAAYPQTVLASQPAGFWRLNETDNALNNGNAGVICNDYQGGNNGIYTNVALGQTGYDPSEPTETSAWFGQGAVFYSYVNPIQGLDFATASGANAEFAVEAWANCGTGGAGGGPVITQGTNGANEAFALGLDTATTPNYQFYIRSANGTVYKADSTIPAADFAWHHLVGVCDEANGKVSLYVDGKLAASTNVPALSGLYEAGAPVSIGGEYRSTAGNNLQFFGYIDDVAAYKYALSAAQVADHYLAVPGNSIPVSFVPPTPPANAVFQANTTLTIPATVTGGPPLGYYWTNVTAGGILGSGQSSVSGSLDATLTIPNPSPNLSGDQLEVVVTNAISSANLFVTLFSPAPPGPLPYTDPILYSNYFNGGTWSIAGMPMTAANTLVGGTNTAWVQALGTNDPGTLQGSGVAASTLGDSWEVPFTPHAGYVYTVNASLTFSGNPGNWVGLGFAQRVPTNAASGFGRFSDGGTTPPQSGPNGFNWMILTEGSGNVQYFAGAGGAGPVTNLNGFFTAGVGTHTVEIVLDTTSARWVMYAFVDGISAGTNTYNSNPPIGAVGITQNGLTTPAFVQWNYFALSQVAPGGVPPYLLNPLPPTNNIVLTNGTVTIPATAFGSGPLGYYWTNNSTIVASGSTNDMAPLPADLSVSSSSLSAGQLQLVVTNAYGTNITVITLVSPINPTPTNIVFSVSGTNLTLSWPPDYTGWTLQSQTNDASSGISTNWVDVVNSATTNQVIVPLNTTNGSVFFRMRLNQ